MINGYFIYLCVLGTQSCPTLCDPWTAARQASLSFTISRSWLKLMSIESVMPSRHLVLCPPPFLLPWIFPSIRAAADEMVRQHHQLNGYEFEPTPGDSEGQGRLACCNPWGFKVIPDLGTEQQ